MITKDTENNEKNEEKVKESKEDRVKGNKRTIKITECREQ